MDGQIEPRWPVAVTILVLVVLLATLPSRLTVFPPWALYGLALALLAPMAAVAVARDKTRWHGVERTVLLLVVVIGLILNVVMLSRLVYAIVSAPSGIAPITLLTSSVANWLVNVILFALLYWLMDRGGPQGRASGKDVPEDFTFVQGPKPRTPVFVDYLALAFNTSTAFSPTDTLPVTSRGKLLMMAQSAISLVTVVIVGARAINILK